MKMYRRSAKHHVSSLLLGLGLLSGPGVLLGVVGWPTMLAVELSPAEQIVIDRCQVDFVEEVAVPAVASEQLKQVFAKANQTVEASQLLAVQDDSSILGEIREAELQRKTLEQRASSQLALQQAKTYLESAKLKADSDFRLDQSSPGLVSRNAVRDSQLAVKLAEIAVGIAEEEQAKAAMTLELQRASIERLEARRRRLQISSPVGGVILAVLKSAGEWAQQGETIARLARMDRLRVSAVVSETQLSPRDAVGTAVTVRWTEGDRLQTLRGTITSVDPQMHDEGQIRIHATIENRRLGEGWLLAPGRRVTVIVHPVSDSAAEMSPATARRLGLEQGTRR